MIPGEAESERALVDFLRLDDLKTGATPEAKGGQEEGELKADEVAKEEARAADSDGSSIQEDDPPDSEDEEVRDVEKAREALEVLL